MVGLICELARVMSCLALLRLIRILPERLRLRILRHSDRPGPLLYVAAELPWFQDEVMSYYWKRDSQGRNIDEPVDHNDHAMNTVKYMLSKLPDPSEIVVPEEVLPPRWKFWQEMNMDDYKRATGRIH